MPALLVVDLEEMVTATYCALDDALVFPEHAEHREWEIRDSRISKLWIQRLEDKR